MRLRDKLKSTYPDYNDKGNLALIGVGVGILTGAAFGLALPPYLGWKIGDYVAKAVEFGPIVGTSTKLIGAIGLSSLTYRFFVTSCALGGAGVGGALGYGVGKVKDSIEKLVSKR